MRKICPFLLLIVLTFSCENEPLITDSEHTDQSVVNKNHPVYKYIISLGFNESSIVEYPDIFIVEGDIGFPKADTNFIVSSSRLKQARTYYTVNWGYRDISIYLNLGSFTITSFKSKLDQALNEVINAYDEISDMFINFSRLYSPSADIVIEYDLAEGGCALSGAPYANGTPYPLIKIDEWMIYDFSVSQLKRLIAHELGHCIGLRHTNWKDRGEPAAIPIPGTPSSDPYSVMNSPGCGNYWGYGFSYYDKRALQILYPKDLRVYISGPEVLECDGCGTWQAITYYAEGTCTYVWYYKMNGTGWYLFRHGGTSQTLSKCFSGGDDTYIQLKVVVSDNEFTKTAYKDIWIDCDGVLP